MLDLTTSRYVADHLRELSIDVTMLANNDIKTDDIRRRQLMR